mmetsp:Transcript_15928/g.38773  ORF Transcript_15928/g.38773 Transcript_15928/m.38773 type:complete len:208 (+) Transcript_15928:314-937(+)
MPNHSSVRAHSVPKGAAPADRWPHTSRLRRKKEMKHTPGNMNAVCSVLIFQSTSWNILNRRPLKYPAKMPMSTNSRSMAVMSPPRFAGLRNPSTANTMVTNVMPSSCTPVPTYTDSRPGATGGRNTSPCTSFHPVSSCASSTVSSWLYWLMSRRSVRTMIIATMPERNSRIMRELMMENQWIWSSIICRYVSQRLAQRMSDILNMTS